MKRNLFENKGEQLTGSVQGKKASDLEERAARAMDKIPDWEYTFIIRVSPITGSLMSGRRGRGGEHNYEIDFLAQRGTELLPIMIDGEISHFFAQWQKVQDEQKEAIINKMLERYGARPVVRVPFWELDTQDRADVYFRRLLQ